MPINSLTENPRPHTALEWLFATLVHPIYEVAQGTGLLRELANDYVHPDVLAERLELSKRGVRCILHCLVAAGIVAEKNDKYHQIRQEIPDLFHETTNALHVLLRAIDDGVFDQATEDGLLPSNTPQELSMLGITEVVGFQQVLTAPGRCYFTPGQDRYLGGYIHYAWQLLTHLMPHLTEVVRTGQPALRAAKNPRFFAPLVETLFPINYDTAQQLAEHLVSFEGVNTVLDLGAGSAVWSIALAQRKTGLQVDALDLPPVLDTAKAFTQRYGVQRQYRFLPGDFMTQEQWGQGSYDLIYVCYLCCGFSVAENQHLLTISASNLRPGGYLILADYLPKSNHTGPLLDVLFSALMLGVTDHGDTYLPETYEAWYQNAGLGELQWITVSASSVPLLIGRRITTQTTLTLPTRQDKEHSSVSTLQKQAPVPSNVPFVPPTPIIDATFAFAQSCMLLAAVELQLFTHIAHGANTLEQLAKQAAVAGPALERLLGGLAAMGFLQRAGRSYVLTPLSERYLVSDRSTYIGDVALQIRREWDAWIDLTEVIRTGQSRRCINEEPLGGKFFAPLVEHLFPLIYPLMLQILKRLEVGTRLHGLRLVDLGAGTAPGAIAALELDSDARATVIDFPHVLEQAKVHVQEHGVNSRIEYYPADLQDLELPVAQFDVVIASHVFRILGADVTQRLISQSYRTLKPGGHLITIETYKEPERDWKIFPHIVSVNMLVNTHHGDAFNSRQMCQWLQTAGFRIEEWANIGPDPVLIATRP